MHFIGNSGKVDFQQLASLALVVFGALIMGIVSFWWHSWKDMGKSMQTLPFPESRNFDFTDLFFQPKLITNWFEKNISRLRSRCTDLERISQLLSFINYSLELPRQLRVALNLGVEIFPNMAILVFLRDNNAIKYEAGSKPDEFGNLMLIQPEDILVKDATKEIHRNVDIEKLNAIDWLSFALPIRSPTPEGFSVMPLLVWNRIRGLIVYISMTKLPLETDERFLTALFNRHLAIFIENHILFKDKIQRERLIHEVEIARTVQNDSLPQSTASILKGYDIFGICNPSNEISGDYYDFVNLSEKHLLVAIADVSGKGLPAALFLSKIQTLVRSVSPLVNTSPSGLLSFISNQLTKERMGSLFATMLLALINADNNTVVFSSAGHCKPFIVREKNGFVEDIHFESGIPLGLFDSPCGGYIDQTIDLFPGDGIFLFSDGVSDLMNSRRERFGTERLKSVLEKSAGEKASALVYRVIDEMNRFKEKTIHEDDITMVYVKSESKKNDRDG